MHKMPIAVILSLFLIGGAAFGSGFEIPEVGARALSLSVAYTAVADDATAVWYNPAAITSLEGTHVSSGFIGIAVPATTFSGTNSVSYAAAVEEESKKELFSPVNLYAVVGPGLGKARFGIGVNSPFGLEKRWPAGSTFASDVMVMGLAPVFINPNVAYPITKCMSVAAGMTVVRSAVSLIKAPYNHGVDLNGNPLDGVEGDRLFTLDMEGHGTGVGFNFALMGRFLEDNLSIGASYRSQIDVEFEGDASFGDISPGAFPVDTDGDGIPDDMISVAERLFGEDGIRNAVDVGKADLPFPAQIRFGAAYRAMENLLISADYHMTQWSSYEELNVDFENPYYEATLGAGIPKDWEDTAALRFGVLYRACPFAEIGLGFVLDENPVPDETISAELPDADRTGISFGITMGEGSSQVTLSYMNLMIDDRDADNLDLTELATTGSAHGQSGTFGAGAHLFGVTLTHAF